MRRDAERPVLHVEAVGQVPHLQSDRLHLAHLWWEVQHAFDVCLIESSLCNLSNERVVLNWAAWSFTSLTTMFRSKVLTEVRLLTL
jgi:hypothetical protein